MEKDKEALVETCTTENRECCARRSDSHRLVLPLGGACLAVILFCGIVVAGSITYNLQNKVSELMARVDVLEKSIGECKTKIFGNQIDEKHEENSDEVEDEDYMEIDEDLKRHHSALSVKSRKRRARPDRSDRNEGRGGGGGGSRHQKKKCMSAIHLSLDVHPTSAEQQRIQNGSIVEMKNGYFSKMGFKPKQTERSDDRRAFAYKDWKAADWVKDQQDSDYEFVQDRGVVKILKKGLYFIYSQILYHNTATRSSYVLRINETNFIKCMESVDAVNQDSENSGDNARYKTCYMGAATVLQPGDLISIHDLYSHTIMTDELANFFGLIKLSEL